MAILGMVDLALEVIIGSILYGVFYDFLHQPEMERYGPVFKFIDVFYGVGIVLCLKGLLFCALLLHGINKKKKDFLLPWMIFQMILLVVSKYDTEHFGQKNQFLSWFIPVCKCVTIILLFLKNCTFSARDDWHLHWIYRLYSIHRPGTRNSIDLLVLWLVFGLWVLLLGCGVFSVSRPES